jgi:hypothetical protein
MEEITVLVIRKAASVCPITGKGMNILSSASRGREIRKRKM